MWVSAAYDSVLVLHHPLLKVLCVRQESPGVGVVVVVVVVVVFVLDKLVLSL